MLYTLNNAVDDILQAMHMEIEDCRFPAEEFEQATGLTGIAHRYTLPEGLTEASMERSLLELSSQNYALSMLADAARGLEDLSPATILSAKKEVKAILKTLTNHAFAIEDSKAHSDAEKEELAYEIFDIQRHALSLGVLKKLADANPSITLDEIEEHRADAYEQKGTLIYNYWRELKQLNPQLNTLENEDGTPPDYEQVYDIVMGVLSRFNLADIQRYTMEDMVAFKARMNPAYEEKRSSLEERAGAPMYWVASPSTLLKVEQQLDRREATIER